ncbi:MAG: hypothetical protein ACHBN1_02675 [Heteroscytonema crispum UTEX LB 1556]
MNFLDHKYVNNLFPFPPLPFALRSRQSSGNPPKGAKRSGGNLPDCRLRADSPFPFPAFPFPFLYFQDKSDSFL